MGASKKMIKNREYLVDSMLKRGWEKDRWGSLRYKNEKSGRLFRLKMQSISARFEIKSGKNWFRINSLYYKDVKSGIFESIADKVEEDIKKI